MGRRIAHVVELARGGITTVVRDLIRHQRARGDAPMLIACRRLISDELAAETGTALLYDSSRHPVRIPAVVREVRQLIARTAPDVLHLHSTFPGLYGRLAVRGRTRPRVIYCPHGWAFAQDLPPWRRRAYAEVERALLPWTDAIVHVSRSEAAAAHGLGIASRNDRTIANAVRDFVPDPEEVTLPGLDPASINLAFFGRFDRQKGLDLLLAAFRERPRPRLRLWLVGSPLRGDAAMPDAAEGVFRIDWLPADRIDAYLRLFDVVVVPSRWEAFGLIALEAMRNGRPVLVSDRGALPEWLIDGYNGLVFQMDRPGSLSEALDLLAERDLALMGRRARQVFEAMPGPAARHAQIDRLYDDVLAEEARAA